MEFVGMMIDTLPVRPRAFVCAFYALEFLPASAASALAGLMFSGLQ